jgi:hypothetical protein
MNQFPWKSLLALLAKYGLILGSYPDILLPREVRGNNKTKGISDLFSTEQVDLATSLGLMGRTNFPIVLLRAPKDRLEGSLYFKIYSALLSTNNMHLGIKTGRYPVVVCRRPPPGSDALQGREAYYSIADKVPTFRTDGPHQLVEDRRLPVAPSHGRVPPKDNDDDIIVVSLSTPQSKASSDKSSDVFASSPQLAA